MGVATAAKMVEQDVKRTDKAIFKGQRVQVATMMITDVLLVTAGGRPVGSNRAEKMSPKIET
jgi:hypothetical protein